jgi:hypothetical protein
MKFSIKDTYKALVNVVKAGVENATLFTTVK